MYVSDKKCVEEFCLDASFGQSSIHSLPKNTGYGDITVSRDPVVTAVVRWSIVILAVVVIAGMIQSFGFVMPWESGNAVGSDAGTIVYLSGNDVIVSIVNGNDTDKISSISLYFEKSGETVTVPNVQSTIRSGELILVKGMADGYSGADNIILEAEFEGGTTKVLSKTYLKFT